MRIKLTLIVALVLLLLPACSRREPQIYFVSLGNVPPQTIEQLTAHYKEKFGVTIKTLPAIRLDRTLVTRHRNQIAAEDLIALMREKYPNVTNDLNAIVIGLTPADIYISGFDWDYAFNLRLGDRTAVVSTARMDPANFSQPANEELLNTRLRKMVTKNIGVLYFRKSLNSNPRSVLYKEVGGVEELDAMGEDF
jgi:predicted Zn-dependent protease